MVFFAGIAGSSILPFGQNKVVRKHFDWQVLRTDNFDIYYYPEEESLAKEVAVLAEKAYAKTTASLAVYPEDIVPLFIYRNQIDFAQTNIITDFIGEGVGGFTEPLKDRIAIPATGSHLWLEKVITHEFTHRLQFEILYGGTGKSLRLLRSVFVPLWFMEGTAEYEAQSVEPDPANADMILRDAVISERIPDLKYLDSFNHFEGRETVLMYKVSQMAVYFIAQTYGPEKVGLIFKEYKKPNITFNQALSHVTGVDLDELNRKFRYYLQEKYWAQATGRQNAEYYGRALTTAEKDEMVFNTKPVFSPDGKQIVFFSDRDNYTAVYTMQLNNFETNQLFGRRYENLVTEGRGFSWSAYGNLLAFVVKDGGKYSICIWDMKEEKEIKCFKNDCDVVRSPAFSPDGKTVAFSGVKNGTSDIYLYNLESGEFRRIMDDRFDDNCPVFSPNGKYLVYVSEHAANNLYYADVSLEKPEPKPLTSGKHNDVEPSFSADGKTVVFSSDRTGIYNIYTLDFKPGETGPVNQLTDTRTGFFNPSFSSDRQKILTASYEEGCYNIYLINTPEKPVAVKTEPAEQPAEAKAATEISGQGTLNRSYIFWPSLDLIYFFVMYDSSSGFMGGTYLRASDMLGDHNFGFMGDYLKDYYSGFEFDYLFLKWRPALGIRLFQWREYYYSTESDMLYWKQDLGGQISVSLPFSQYSRADLFVSTMIRTVDYVNDDEGPSNKKVNSAGISLVKDKLRWNIDEPCGGWATNLTVERAEKWLGGQERYTDAMLEHQFYIGFTRETVFSGRLFAGISTDTDRGNFLLGGFDTLRGYLGNEFYGDKSLIFNLELRWPLVSNLNILVWPYNWLLIKKIKAAIFTDNGMAWSEPIDVKPTAQLKNSLGVGFRMHTFLAESMPLIIRFDIAWRTDTESSAVYYIAFGEPF